MMREVNTSLTKEEFRGYLSLKKRIKEHNIVVCESDKTGRLVVVERETYLRLGAPHRGEDRTVKYDEIREIQRLTNGHTSAWLKILGTGEAWNHLERIKTTTINSSNNVASMKLLVRDQERKWNDGCHKCRPVVARHEGLNSHLNNLISDLIGPIAEHTANSIEVISSKDLLSRAAELNTELEALQETEEGLEGAHKLMLLAVDAEALYSSLRRDETTNIVRKMLI